MCRSRRELSNEYLLAKIGVDTAENEPLQVCPLSAYRSPRFPPTSGVAQRTRATSGPRRCTTSLLAVHARRCAAASASACGVVARVVDALDGAEPSREDFLQVLDPHVLVRGLESFADHWWRFVIDPWHLLRFKLIILNLLVNKCVTGVVIARIRSDSTTARPAAASVVTRHAEEARAQPLAEV